MRTIILKAIPVALSLWLAGAAQAQIKIGVAGPITGANASFGAQLTQGVDQAAEDINKAGGILGQKIEVEPGDDVSDPKQGVSVANKFVGDGVKFVVGHFNSCVTIPASDVYSENGILFITPSATNPKVTDRMLWDAFRTCGRDDQQGMLWAEYARDKLKGKKIAVVHDKTTYGKGLADAAAKDVVAEFKAKDFDPEAYTLYSYAAVQIMKQAAEATKSLDPKKIAEYMHSGKTFHTVIGDIAYDKKGDRTSVDYVWYTWEKGPDGKITYVQNKS